jgi:hypothetical protein
MGPWNAGQALDLELVARYECCVLGVKGDIVAVNGLVGKLAIEIVGVADGARRMKVGDSYGACLGQRLNM